MKLIRIGLAIGTANAALGLATTAVPEGTAVVAFIGITMAVAELSFIVVIPTNPLVIITIVRAITVDVVL